MIKVIICDDQSLIRDGLEMLIKLEDDIEVAGKASNGQEAVELVEKNEPDLVLMDLKMSGMNGIAATRQIRQNHPMVKVLILTTYDDDEWLFDALKAGASGYILKDTPREEVIKALRGTVEGHTFLDPHIAGKIISRAAGENRPDSSLITNKLTRRETEVLQYLAHGQSNGEIAEHLFLSEGTVRNHISVIFGKLGVSDRTQAAILAVQHGLDKL
jgi:two-component system, NarL family, response regulator LiaR